MNILPLLSQRRKSGAYKMIIWFIFFFIVSQIIIEKGQLPTVVYQLGLVKTLVFTASLYYSFHDNWRISKSTSIARWLYNNPV